MQVTVLFDDDDKEMLIKDVVMSRSPLLLSCDRRPDEAGPVKLPFTFQHFCIWANSDPAHASISDAIIALKVRRCPHWSVLDVGRTDCRDGQGCLPLFKLVPQSHVTSLSKSFVILLSASQRQETPRIGDALITCTFAGGPVLRCFDAALGSCTVEPCSNFRRSR